jgi:16S rRNA G966 N2-methylase RsmD
VVFVDLDLTWARKNAADLKAPASFIQLPALRAIEQLVKRGEKFDLVFSDPPYALEAAGEILEAVHPLLTEGARVIIEHAKREAVPSGFVDQRKFGDTIVTTYQPALRLG